MVEGEMRKKKPEERSLISGLFILLNSSWFLWSGHPPLLTNSSSVFSRTGEMSSGGGSRFAALEGKECLLHLLPAADFSAPRFACALGLWHGSQSSPLGTEGPGPQAVIESVPLKMAAESPSGKTVNTNSQSTVLMIAPLAS